jgi:hypothetical protein
MRKAKKPRRIETYCASVAAEAVDQRSRNERQSVTVISSSSLASKRSANRLRMRR